MFKQIDERILAELQKNAKATTSAISKWTGIPTSTVHHRIKRMEKEKIIKTYRPVVDYEKIGKGISALIFVTTEPKADQGTLAKLLRNLPNVERTQIITGVYDILVEVHVGSMHELNTLLVNTIRKTEGVDKTQTMMILDEFD